MNKKEWPKINKRRGHLIDLKIQGQATDDELVELEQLQAVADEYLDEVAPRPTHLLEELEIKLRSKS